MRIDREVEGPRDLGNAFLRCVLIEQDSRVHRLVCQDDVLGHRHDGDQHEVLVHHSDPTLDRGLGRADLDGLTVHQDLALVGRIEAVEDAHERRLPGAVLAEERVHLAAPEVEVDVVVREDAGEALRDPA
jgi:hypothetical protein